MFLRVQVEISVIARVVAKIESFVAVIAHPGVGVLHFIDHVFMEFPVVLVNSVPNIFAMLAA